MLKNRVAWTAAALPLVILTASAMAHPGHGSYGSSAVAGVLHPITGMDHLLAIVASGLLAARVGTRRAWAVPASFGLCMLVGAACAAGGLRLPYSEWAIAATVIVLGLLVALLPRVPLWMATSVVGAGAFFHGHAHAAEFEGSSLPLYMTGFLATTMGLQAAAYAFGVRSIRMDSGFFVRGAGAGIAVGFAVLALMGTQG